MSGAWLYGTRDLRRRWLTFVALGLLAAVAGGLVLAAWAGARRTHTSIDRFVAVAHSPHLVGPIAKADEGLWDQLIALPDVESAARITGLAVMSQNDFDAGLFTFWGVDDDNKMGDVIERPVVLRGRRADPQSADEVTLYESTAKKWLLDVGDTLRLMSWIDGAWATATASDNFVANGPTLELKVVGIVRSPNDVLSNDNGVSVGVLPAGLARAHPEIDTIGQLAFYRVRGGVANATAFIESSQNLVNQTPKENPDDAETTFEVADFKGQIGDALNVAQNGQLAFAVIGAFATALTMLIAITRVVRNGERQTLSALGMPTRSRVLAAIVPLAATATIALVGSAALAYFGSRLFMPSLARRADPQFGPRFDTVVMVAALGGTVILLAMGAIASLGREQTTTTKAALGRAPVGGAPTLLGLSLGRLGRAGRAGTGRGALIGVIVALIGISGGAIYVRSLDSLGTDRVRWGLNADFTADGLDGITKDSNVPGVAAIVTLHYGFTFINGTPVHTVAFEPVIGHIEPELLKGRLPVDDSEIALASQFFAHGIHIGSTVSALDNDGNGVDLQVVGEAVPPPLDGRGTLSNSALITAGAFQRLRVDQLSNTSGVRVAPGATQDEAIAALGARVKNVFPISRPVAISNLAAMRGVIVSLIGLLAFLGLSGALLSFVGSIRRGRANIAIGRAIGMTHRSIRATLVIFVGGVVVAGAILALLAGYIAGLSLWRIQSDNLGVRHVTVVPWGVLAAAFVMGVVLAALLGAFVGDRFGRARSFEVLRAE